MTQRGRQRGGLWGRFLIGPVLAALLLQPAPATGPSPARAETNPILSMTKDAVYGAAMGLFLSGVLTLVVDADKREDTVRWGVVIGTFGGFAYGVYETALRGEGEFSLKAPGRSEPPPGAGAPPIGSEFLGRRQLGRREPGTSLLVRAPERVRLPIGLGRVSW